MKVLPTSYIFVMYFASPPPPTFQQDFMAEAKLKERCDIVLHLIQRGCKPDFIESPNIDVTMPSNEANIQVIPGEASVQLRPGLDIRIIVLI